jgi:hypothetical protein
LAHAGKVRHTSVDVTGERNIASQIAFGGADWSRESGG